MLSSRVQSANVCSNCKKKTCLYVVQIDTDSKSPSTKKAPQGLRGINLVACQSGDLLIVIHNVLISEGNALSSSRWALSIWYTFKHDIEDNFAC